MNVRRWVRTYLATSPAIRRKATARLRQRGLQIERLETRKVLASTPYATLQLVRSTADSLASAPIIRLDTYEFGYQSVIDSTSGASLAPKLDALSATANHAENGSSVFADVVKNKVFARAVLTQRDSNGDAVSAWVMTNLQVLNERVISDVGSTVEDLQFSFRQITEASSLAINSWDTSLQGQAAPQFHPKSTCVLMQQRLAFRIYNFSSDPVT